MKTKRLAALVLALVLCLSLWALPAAASGDAALTYASDEAVAAAPDAAAAEAPVPDDETPPAEDGYPPALPLPALTGEQSVDTAAIARSQVGYVAEDGTVYGAWWKSRSIYWYRDYTHTEWCGVFVTWCADKAGAGIDVAFNEDAAVVDELFTWLKKNAYAVTDFSDDPRPGDFLFFGYSNGKAGHAVIVTDYDPETRLVTYVGGNQSNPDLAGGGTKTDGRVVSEKSIEWSADARDAVGRRILGYGRPNYNDAPHVVSPPPTPAPTPEPTPVPTPEPFDPLDADHDRAVTPIDAAIYLAVDNRVNAFRALRQIVSAAD